MSIIRKERTKSTISQNARKMMTILSLGSLLTIGILLVQQIWAYPSQPLSYLPLQSEQLHQLLRQLNPPSLPSGIEGIDCVYVINLDERPERWNRVQKEFEKQKINPYRASGINGWKIPEQTRLELTMRGSDLSKQRFAGAVGCLLSHLSIYKDALKRGFEVTWICEDDITFKQSAEKISPILRELTLLDPEWDVLYTDRSLGGATMQKRRPGQLPYRPIQFPISENLLRIHGRYNTHSMIFSKRGLTKVFAYFTSRRLWSPIDIDIHYTPNLREYSVAHDLVTSLYDSSIPATDGSSDTQQLSILNEQR